MRSTSDATKWRTPDVLNIKFTSVTSPNSSFGSLLTKSFATTFRYTITRLSYTRVNMLQISTVMASCISYFSFKLCETQNSTITVNSCSLEHCHIQCRLVFADLMSHKAYNVSELFGNIFPISEG